MRYKFRIVTSESGVRELALADHNLEFGGGTASAINAYLRFAARCLQANGMRNHTSSMWDADLRTS